MSNELMRHKLAVIMHKQAHDCWQKASTKTEIDAARKKSKQAINLSLSILNPHTAYFTEDLLVALDASNTFGAVYTESITGYHKLFQAHHERKMSWKKK